MPCAPAESGAGMSLTIRGLRRYWCMQGLRKQPGNHAHALHQVPRNSRHLYVHAYQSYLWNAAASHRVQAHGAEAAVAGDLVIPSGGTEPADSALRCCSALLEGLQQLA